MFKRISSATCLSMLVLAGCGSLEPSPKPVYSDNLTAGQYRAAYELAEARCDRQTDACSSFATHEQCMQTKLEASADDARLRQCTHRVDQSEVQACAAEIRHGTCGSGISQITACQQAELCPYTSEEGTL